MWPLDPSVDEIDIVDIAHGLSRVCRWNGQCLCHFSVAAHSIIVSEFVPVQFALTGLLHDASEAFLPDMAAPVKTFMPEFQRAENRLMDVIAKKYRIIWPVPKPVKAMDLEARRAEQGFLFPGVPITWDLDAALKRRTSELIGLPPDTIEELFINRYAVLTTKPE